MYTFETQIRVRYAETDQMGYVYYGNYGAYYEVARTEALRILGVTYKELEKQGIIMPVLENYSKFIRPAKYDDLLLIKVFVKDFPDSRIRFEYEVYNEAEKLINLGHTTLVFISADTNKAVEMPDFLVDILKPYFNGQ
ncbi:acyl-CoA thioesterase [Bacteroidota bacterium]